ncbi:hypothetical protein LAZ67_1007056 [Cordylochernes scorpioides]|uniref:Uncharacterized protein n=1 Tax=Cordylochernes scorpioides TaxID=51811 RepID=A0ABY6K066_9ARAC|nr:hypothetical protein LAZ67_1007056 [Cordylochernes scorpioides]
MTQNVLQNVKAEGKTSVVKLYDRLETQLRAFETLGVARGKFVAMLYQLVESTLPEDTLRIWERSQLTATMDSRNAGLSHVVQSAEGSITLLCVLLWKPRRLLNPKKRN